MAIPGMRPGATASKAAAVATFAVALSGCAGLLDSAPPAPTQDAGGERIDAVLDSGAPESADVALVPDAYGAEYQGDAGACATVICSGAQVCCVLPAPSDAPTPRPNNKCDYDCVAACMDSCPAVSADGVDAAPTLMDGMHGGGLRQVTIDAASE
jgi:hypothetical protein